MATLANIFGKFGAQSIEAVETVSGPARDGGTRIRPFANEDIYFFVKHIDNTAVIRAVDPAADRASWKMIGTAAAAAVFLIAVLIPKAYSVLDGYKIQGLRAEQRVLLGERAALELEEASLMSPERMALLAKQQQFVDPSASNIVYLPGGQNDAEMAAVSTSK
ncbi:MAG: hypothetical protein ABIR70_15400 [Bryobacteraceae bacterium]